MNRREALNWARRALFAQLNEDASLEGEILLKHVLKIDRTALFSSPDEDMTQAQLNELDKLIARRLEGEPSAYITGHKEFYGLDFVVDKRVLIPRPETEILVENAVSLTRSYKFTYIADIGTGCGCIAVSLSVKLIGACVYAVDVSRDAITVAKQNAARHGVKWINFLYGDLLQPLHEPVDIIVANLPYVKKSDLPVNGFEPVTALDGGEDGLDIIRKLIRQAPAKLNPYGCLLLEIGLGQAEAVELLLQKEYPSAKIQLFPDLAGIPRAAVMRLT
ncbi:MAG: protein-(glutamine-N5) methyltransferase, release factor-specific [Chloroflexi bacterium RBG_13_51_18]|nr:MAG: protein-(glutamine-N5) methyltransferase, release factor-specific [Chloroflexi bacterium RBG_13_51_18]